MEPARIRVTQIADFGTFVAFVGVDVETDEPVAVYVDHRPFTPFWQAWQEAGCPEPVDYDADGLTLNVDIVHDDEAVSDLGGDGSCGPTSARDPGNGRPT